METDKICIEEQNNKWPRNLKAEKMKAEKKLQMLSIINSRLEGVPISHLLNKIL